MFSRFTTKVNVLRVVETDDDAGTTTKTESMRHFELPAHLFVETRQFNDEMVVNKKISDTSDRLMYSRVVTIESTDIVVHGNNRYEVVSSYSDQKGLTKFQVTRLRRLE